MKNSNVNGLYRNNKPPQIDFPKNHSNPINKFGGMVVHQAIFIFVKESLPKITQELLKNPKENDVKFSHKLIQKSMNPQRILNLLGRVIDVPEQIPDAAFFAKYDIVKDWFLDLCLRTTKLDKINYNYSISNLGKFGFPTQYKNLAVEKVYFHTYGEMAEKALTVVTIADKLTLCLSFRDSITEKANAKEIMDVALRYLIS